MLEFHSSSSGAVNTRRAVAECLENALGEATLDCDLIIFYTTMGHDFAEMLSEFHRLSPGARTVGCTCTGVIGREGPNESMRALAIMAIRGPRNELAAAGREKITKADSYEVARSLALDLRRDAPAANMVFFHPSGFGVFPEDAIQGIESVFGPDVPILGGLSADNLRFVGDFQFIDDRIFERGAVAVGFADPTIQVVTRANHGYRVVGDPLLVTRSERNRIMEIDGRPAWAAWAAAMGLPPTAGILDVAPAPLVRELPEDLHEEYDSRYIHILYYGSYGSAGGVIDASTACPEGTRLWLTRRDEKEIFAGTDRMVARIVQSCRGSTIVAVFQADCNARGRMLFSRVLKEEIESRMQGPLCGDRSVPWLGMYGGGEFAPLGGRNRIHAMTSALYVLERESRSREMPRPASGTDAGHALI